MLPEACGLRIQTIEHARNGDAMVRCGHLRCSLGTLGRDGFALRIPAAVKRLKIGLLTCGFMSRPPVSELLIPALRSSGAADADGSSPYGGMSIGMHRTLLPACCHLLCSVIYQPLGI